MFQLQRFDVGPDFFSQHQGFFQTHPGSNEDEFLTSVSSRKIFALSSALVNNLGYFLQAIVPG
ncbi:hypothetical protein SDC9_177218 [bioreactor metagenome]|uniref:Uncharacterized protein n=1 Tax=bioreactor metagenome TaxID=1076179 RepID=A0A645GSP7_9ZZZZ